MTSPTNPDLFVFGFFTIRWFSVLIIIGIWVGAYVSVVRATGKQENTAHVWNLLYGCLVFGLLGSRLYPATLSLFQNNPFFTTFSLFTIAIPFPTILIIWQGGLEPLGAIGGVFMAVWWYAHRHNLNIWRWFDIASLGLLPAQAIGRWGHFFNQEWYGYKTNLPWGITITNPDQRLPPYLDETVYPLDATLFHPLFLYESGWCLIGLALLFWISHSYRQKLRDGDLFLLYLLWYPTGRILIELLQFHPEKVMGVSIAQIVCGIMLLFSSVMLCRRRLSLYF